MSLTITLTLMLVACVLGWVIKKQTGKRNNDYKTPDQRTYCSGDLVPSAHLNAEHKPMYIIFNTSPQARKKQPE